ncbi:MAG: sugar ABC transporter ATP-binding protein [Acetobacteraceae bacterium]|nr:sugar ABC transporter ATP-binding protein [Acetobacteraceae bacterium]
MASAEWAVAADNVTKRFAAVTALSHVDFTVKAGEIHALLGENGAGKSTLIKVISGVWPPDSGSVSIGGKSVTEYSPLFARRLGVATVFQELSLVPDLSVEENMFLGREPSPFPGLGWIDRRERRRRALSYLELAGANVSPRARVASLGAAQQQLVEIAKALSADPSVLILDEPTDKLFGEEQKGLFTLLRRLRAEGKAIIYITHKLEEVPEIADRVTVLRDGIRVGTQPVAGLPVEGMIKMMVGRELGELFPKAEMEPGPELLRVEGLTVGDRLQDVSFTVRRGEVVGVMGLVGAGRTLLIKAISGVARPSAGSIYFDGRRVEVANPCVAVGLGMGFLPEDRRAQGLLLLLSVRENIVLASLRRWLLDHRQMSATATAYVKRLGIRTPSIRTRVSSLSGGNQQKVVLARWLCSKARLFMFDEPTQGIDVGTKVEIYNLMNELTRAGAGILMVSSDMKEILGMSDRILVLRKGRLVSEYSRGRVEPERLLADALEG